MILMCHNEISNIYDNGDTWVIKTRGQEDEIYSKKQEPLMPLSAVIKWGMTEDNKTEMDKLRKKAMEE